MEPDPLEQLQSEATKRYLIIELDDEEGTWVIPEGQPFTDYEVRGILLDIVEDFENRPILGFTGDDD